MGSIISIYGMAGEAEVITAGEFILAKRILNFITLQCFLEPSEPKGGVSTGNVLSSTSAELSDAGKLEL